MPLKPKTITSRTKVTKGRIVSSSDGVVDARLKRKIEYVVEGLPSRCFDHLCKKVLPGSKENVLIICDYISSLKSEINPSNKLQGMMCYHTLIVFGKLRLKILCTSGLEHITFTG